MNKYISNYETLLTSAKIGIEFEFCSNMKPVAIVKSLSEALDKRVIAPLNVDSIENPKLKYHTPVEPSTEIFKLESDYSCGKNGCELITGPLPYKEARIILIKVFNWIKKNGWTTDRCSVHFNISYDDNIITLKNELCHLNILKFCLNIDEDRIYKEFPNRKLSIYANSVKHLLLTNIFTTNNTVNQLSIPNEKYYGANFQKVTKNYLEFRYLGCTNYEERSQIFLEMMDYFITFTYNILENPELSETDNKKLNKIVKDHQKIREVYKDPRLLRKNFPKLNVYVDMNNDIEVIKTYWTTIQNKVLEVLLNGGVRKGTLNYDTDISKMQLKDAEFNTGFVNDMELISCSGNGSISTCKLFECNFKNVVLSGCWLLHNNYIESSKIENCTVDESNICKDCYIENKGKLNIFNGTTVGGVFRIGTIGRNAEIADETDIIQSEKQTEPVQINYGTYYLPDKGQYKDRIVLSNKIKI